MQFTGVYKMTDTLAALNAAVTLLETTAPSDASVALVRAWFSPRGAVLDQIQEINVFINDAAGTGTSQTPTPLHEGYTAYGGTGRDVITVEGTTPTDLIEDGFHFQNGWLYTPIPEEFIVVQPSSIIGIRLPVAPDAAMGCAFGMVFGKIG